MFNDENQLMLINTLKDLDIPYGILKQAEKENPWFTEREICTAFEAIKKKFFDKKKLAEWLNTYPHKSLQGEQIGIIMAGNIPMVGFFDLWAVILSGAEAYVKLSSKDTVLMQWLIDQIKQVNRTVIINPLQPNEQLNGIIATGSNNANRYFKSAYRDIPAVFRGNRYSVSVLTGEESPEQLMDLWEDVFLYYGLGCRNVSHLFVPEEHILESLVQQWILAGKQITHPMFLHNYLQNQAIMRMEETEYLDGGYFTLSQEEHPSLGLSHLTYSIYRSQEEVITWIRQRQDEIQCVVSNLSLPYRVDFGKSQYPELWDYPDHIDLMKFLYTL